MATKQTITVNEMRRPSLNVSHTVGAGGRNDPGDVMLIQAMFQFIAASRLGPEALGVNSMDDVPAPTGKFDSKTAQLIKAFQRKFHPKLLLRADGLIHHGDYILRNISFEDKESRLMSITLLHLLCMMVRADYTTEITREFPQLLPFIVELEV